MRQLIFVSSVALLALSGAALADSRHSQGSGAVTNVPVYNTGSFQVNVDFTKSTSNTTTQTNTTKYDNYSGFQGFTASEHNGGVDVKTNGTGSINASTKNEASATFNGYKVAPTGGSTTTVTDRILGIPVKTTETVINPTAGYNALSSDAKTFSGSTVSANFSGAGSASGSAGGYSKSSSGARDEWGSSVSQIGQTQYQTTTNWSGSGSVVNAR